MIELSVEVSGAPLGIAELLGRVSAICCAVEGIPEAISFGRLVDDSAIRAINREFRAKDAATDVLSFPSVRYPVGKTAKGAWKRLLRERDPESGKAHLGDFVISLPRAQAQALEYGHSLLRELAYLTAHAHFHLMGYDHEQEGDKRRMRELEECVMEELNLKREHAPSDQQLFDKASEAMQSAYTPYSRFRVGACVLADDGSMHQGCNIENASYGLTICAERAAVSAAVIHGRTKLVAVAIAGEQGVAWPCGACRQVLNEFGPDMRVLCGQAGQPFETTTLGALLPHAFGPSDLK